MLNKSHTKEMEKKAWKVIGDPLAKEEKWQAACKIVEGKNYEVSSTVPKPVGLLITLALSVVGSFGGYFLIFVLIGSALLLIGPNNLDPFMIATVFAMPFSMLYLFNSIFTYQKHKWKGGRAWEIVRNIPFTILIAGLTFALTMNLSVGTFLGAGICLALILSAVTANRYGKIITEKSIKNLETSMGSSKLMDYTTFGLCAASIIPFTARLIVHSQETAIMFYVSTTFAIMALTSYIAVRKNKVTSKRTSDQISSFIWSPLVIASTIFVPMTLLGIYLYGTMIDMNTITASLICLGGSSLTIALLLFFPRVGSAIAQKHTQNDLVKSLVSAPKFESSPQHKLPANSSQPLPKSETA